MSHEKRQNFASMGASISKFIKHGLTRGRHGRGEQEYVKPKIARSGRLLVGASIADDDPTLVQIIAHFYDRPGFEQPTNLREALTNTSQPTRETWQDLILERISEQINRLERKSVTLERQVTQLHGSVRTMSDKEADQLLAEGKSKSRSRSFGGSATRVRSRTTTADGAKKEEKARTKVRRPSALGGGPPPPPRPPADLPLSSVKQSETLASEKVAAPPAETDGDGSSNSSTKPPAPAPGASAIAQDAVASKGGLYDFSDELVQTEAPVEASKVKRRGGRSKERSGSPQNRDGSAPPVQDSVL